MNQVKNIISICLILVILLANSINVYATDLQTKLNVIQPASEIKYLENNQGNISKTIVDSNADIGEVSIELKLSNTRKDEMLKKDGTEIVIVIDNSKSMEDIVEGAKTRRDILIEAAKQFVDQVYNSVDNVKIGIVKYYGYDVDEQGEKIQTIGTIDTANIIQGLTEDKEKVVEALNKINEFEYELSTNTDAGLLRAKNMISNVDSNRFIVLFSDGVPNNAIGLNFNNYTYGGLLGRYPTEEAAIEAMDKYIIEKTKTTMNSIEKDGINLISILSGLGELEETDLNVLTSVFGTPEEATTGKFYNIADSNIQKIVTEDIYSDVMEKIQKPINEVKIVDYFPEEIINNFEFSYLGNPSIGNVSENIDTENKTIEWNVGTLKGNEVVTLKYKLKIKDMNNKDLLDKVISTNEKVVLTYKDTDFKDYTVTLSTSPKIQLSEIKDELQEDTTIAKTILPRAGLNMIVIIIIGAVVIITVIISKKYKSYNDIK